MIMATNYPINPRIRAYGKARLDLARRARNGEEWKRIWKSPTHPYPFRLGGAWKQCIEYKVDDFAAEVGFLIDVLGLEVNSLDPGYAQFTSPQGDFYFAVVETPPGYNSTPPDALRIQFMVEDIFDTAEELERRGIVFELPPQPCQAGSALNIGSFLTPHGITIELWGLVNDTIFSHYAESEDELVELMSNEDEQANEEETQSGLGTTSQPTEQVTLDEEEFFPDLEEKDEPKPARNLPVRKAASSSSTARGNIPTLKPPSVVRRSAPVKEEDVYIEVDENEVENVDEGQEEDIEYVDEVDGA
jgi:catechol 2,3-dioxygenase-like lactoylglutathione lyase family enzyme